MTFRVVEVELRARFDPYQQGLNQAGQATNRFADQVRQAGARATGTFDGTVTAVVRYSDQIGRATTSVRSHSTAVREAATETASAWSRMASGANGIVQLAAGFGTAQVLVQGFRTATHFATDAVFGFNNQLQTATLGFETMLGSGEKARALLSDLQHFAVTTPFEFPDLVVASQRMLAMGFSAKEIIPDLTAIGDAVAGLGGGKDLIDRVTIALGQLLTRGKVTADNMRQLTEAGIPAWQILADKMHLTTSQVQDLSQKGLIPARQAIDFLVAGIEERFGGLMGKVSHTWSGALSNIKDISVQSLAGVFRPFFDGVAHQADQLGTRLTSTGFQEWIKSVEHAETRILPELGNQLHRLDPTFHSVGMAAGDVVRILEHLGQAVAPIAVGITGLAGSAVIGSLNTMASTLAAITGFLGDHQDLVLGLASIYVARFVPALMEAVGAQASLIGTGIGVYFLEAKEAVLGYTASLDAAKVSTVAFTSVRTLGIAAIIYSIVSSFQAGKQAAKDFKSEVERGIDVSRLAGMSEELDRVHAKSVEAAAALNRRLESAGAAFSNLNPFDQTEHKLQGSLEEAQKLEAQVGAMRDNLVRNMVEISNRTGLSVNDIEDLAHKSGVDLTKGFEASGPARQKLVDDVAAMARAAGVATADFGTLGAGSLQMSQQVATAIGDAAKATGLSSAEIVKQVGQDEDAIKSFGDSVGKAMQATATSWGKDADVISTVSSQIAQDTKDRASQAEQAGKSQAAAADRHTKAVGLLHDAQQRLADLDQRQAAKATRTISDTQAHARAVDAVAKAQDAVNKAVATGDQKAIPGAAERLSTFYSQAIGNARTFTAQINEATTRGLDPQLIARLLEAGPETAGPVLQTILADHSGRLISMVNESETALQHLTDQAVEMARLSNIAVHSQFDGIAKDLKTAMAASQAEAASGGKLTVDALATQLGQGVDTIRRIMSEYGITVAEGVNPVLRSIGAEEIVPADFVGPLTANQRRGHPAGPNPTSRADGGVDPFIARQPTILMGERETWGESFIPFAPAKRERAIGLWLETGQHLGVLPMANGGVVPAPPDFSRYGWLGSGAAGADSIMFKAVTSWLASSVPGMGGPVGTAPAGAVTDWLAQALSLAGKPRSWLDGLYQIAIAESGGNPLARNNWDVNAKQGNPSEGLMQTTISTFRAHMMAGHGNIFDPVDNAIAAIGYISSRYGAPGNTPGLRATARGDKYTNYADGGIVSPMARGGILGTAHRFASRFNPLRAFSRRHGENWVQIGGHESARLRWHDDETDTDYQWVRTGPRPQDGFYSPVSQPVVVAPSVGVVRRMADGGIFAPMARTPVASGGPVGHHPVSAGSVAVAIRDGIREGVAAAVRSMPRVPPVFEQTFIDHADPVHIGEAVARRLEY